MWLSDFTLVLPDRIVSGGSILIADGKIADIKDHAVAGGIRGDGKHLFPGFIDMHGDMIELELEPRVHVDFPMDVALGHLDVRLAATGVTTAYAAVSFSRGARSGERRSFVHTCNIIRELKQANQAMRVDHKIHARFDITFTEAIDALGDLLADGQVDLVSVMDHTPGQGQYRNLERHIELRAAHHGISLEDARAMVHAKMDAATDENEVLTNLQRVAALCREHNIALASHDDDTVEKSNLIADLGAIISEFPVTMEAAETVVTRGLMTAMGAPNAMRGQSYSGNLSARDAHAAGLLHILAADYHPAAVLPAIRALAETDPNGLAGATRLASANPARALGLLDRGEIAIGKRADLFIVDAQDRVLETFLQGETVHANGTMSATLNRQPSVA
ncbi:alpha-D-ribose 1-methylphosphonate 5-triphosphate diphosphatase [Loktanella sp. D2R18]|uniref:alpha-D-ribose 1-methylphosphonate 5-triphosphate diphosphatase n=1 Tax=Rhodobacterales TaxID=204455 RepID=UPI000DE95320|nr:MULTISPECIES: alpha-D-ribose 1-methylphosphonate 5-triphosphate diphosphatase [Rhodobacterales]MDO6589939.1 alpha-D-ribose 1-methylphosphonate 5-triphosphate diphosphatase [Yoonia sp. 1_MG-2023]RBW45915.1 alpha-D-ribose 1-methylphosphonate 5-triphosphate diphosphatase [Loktanella sp. D2R18]